jgi:hypothetical protein
LDVGIEDARHGCAFSKESTCHAQQAEDFGVSLGSARRATELLRERGLW